MRNPWKPGDGERPDYSLVEYCGPPRCGKTTMLVSDLVCKCLNGEYGFGYEPDDVYVNFPIYIPGVHCVSDEGIMDVLDQARGERWRNKVFIVDEASQPPKMYARGYKNEKQTAIVTYFWQVPKSGSTLLFTSNVGNSVDVQLRDATQFTVLPRWVVGATHEESKIKFRVANAYGGWTVDGVLHGAWMVQKLFDSFAPTV